MRTIEEIKADIEYLKEDDLDDTVIMDCMKELLKYREAERDGRLHIIPNIPKNKTLYWIWGNEIMPVLYKGVRGGCIASDKKYHVTHDMATKKDRTFIHKKKSFTYKAGDKRMFYSDDIGKTVFLTKEEAEQALRKEDEGK